MGTGRHYTRAPITEALIDLRVDAPDLTFEKLAKVHEGLESAYPTQKTITNTRTRVQGLVGKPEIAASAVSEQAGHLFVSGNGKYVFQARLNGFTLSRLAPYENWETFRDEARRLWDVYRTVAKPTKVSRMAVRYINRLDLPLPNVDLKDYLRTVPEISPELPQNLVGYFMQLRIPQADIKSMLIVNQTIIDPARPGVASVALDNDIFRSDDVPTSEQEIWDFYEVLRQRKNEVFEASITDNARELFQ